MPGNILDLAISFLAVGLDPERSIIFVQSDVPEHTELAWLFNAVTPVGDLERMTQYKDKSQRFESVPAGILNYPILQAADILLYGGTQVPVGADQKQNLEISRDVAQRFNRAFCPDDDPIFPLPEPLILDEVAVVPGLDGRKMSKSYGNAIEIFLEGKALKKKVMAIVTDSKGLDEPKDPETCNVFRLIKLFADPAQQAEIAAKYRAGGYGYGHAKLALIELINERFAEARERRRELARHPSTVHDILAQGAARARRKAAPFLEQVRERTGLRWR